ncbi:MAG TPA: ABC transporter ATP-binding protein [Stellaceae bacterium]|nr:ABC transporter ATP-binding protein [Stellaceae bacterium]
MTLLSVDGLAKSYGGVRAVAGVSFSLADGEFLALIGPNGAGKTTCFNMLNGQIRPDAGSVRLGSRAIAGLTPRQIWRLGVGRTFQVAQSYASMTVSENVQLGLIAHHRRLFSFLARAADLYREQAMALLEQVGMAAQADRPCGVLAYGDLKRLELAVALANSPRLLLMDEPTAGMAAGERLSLMALAASLARARGISMLFTEHDMDVVFGHADRIIVMNRGSIIGDGTPSAVRSDPQVREVYLGADTAAA